MNIGERIKQKRETLGWSQREFSLELQSRNLGLDAPALSRIENNSRDLRLSELVTIAAALNATVAWIITGAHPGAAEESYASGYRDGITAARNAIEGLSA